ncbi:hypothetical protein OUZ56_026995 [Daphnia magna]|uniref:Uncharacterized protein n=1 Tax=Daphnia magna TaxID=35525 RepID=A0ABQ9ZNG6_9CRUS|nr:hypothetical protein OUZ56_026995 [Daphnia magna]
MNSPIRKLPGAKKQFAHVQSKVDCKRPAIPSAEAAKPVRVESPKLKTKSPVVTGASSFKSPPVQELAKPFHAKPVPPSHYGQPFRPVLRRKSPLPNNEAPKVMEVPTAKAVEAAPSQDAVEEVAEVDVAVEVPVEAAENAADVVADQVEEVPAVDEVVEVAPAAEAEAVEEVPEVDVAVEVPVEAAENAADVVADQVEEVPAVDEVVEVAPAAEAEAVEEDAAQVIEELPVAEEAVEAADEDEAEPPVVALAAEALLPSELFLDLRRRREELLLLKSRGSFIEELPVAEEAVEAADEDEAAPPVVALAAEALLPSERLHLFKLNHTWSIAQLTRKQKRNIRTKVPVAENAADVVADQVEEVPAVDEVVEVAPAAEAEAVEEDAAQRLEAADEDEAAPPYTDPTESIYAEPRLLALNTMPRTLATTPKALQFHDGQQQYVAGSYVYTSRTSLSIATSTRRPFPCQLLRQLGSRNSHVQSVQCG